ncbi:hypothetical protein L9F63_004047, partial [Diploptera punctata]
NFYTLIQPRKLLQILCAMPLSPYFYFYGTETSFIVNMKVVAWKATTYNYKSIHATSIMFS